MAIRLRLIPALLIILGILVSSAMAEERARLEIIQSNLQKRNAFGDFFFEPLCNIRLSHDEFDRETVSQLKTAIERVEAQRSAENGVPGLCLQGPGGDLDAALDAVPLLGGWITIVEEGHDCLSACAVLFMGGGRQYNRTVERQIATFDADRGALGSGRYLHVRARLGFHAPDYRIFAPDHRIALDPKNPDDSGILEHKDIDALKALIETTFSDLIRGSQVDLTSLSAAKSKIIEKVQSLLGKDILTFKQAMDGHEIALRALERLLFVSTIPSDADLKARDPGLDSTRPQIQSNAERIPWTTHQDSDFFPPGLVFSFLYVNGVDEHNVLRFYFIDTVEKALLWGIELYGLKPSPAITESMLINGCLNYVSLACYQGMPCIIIDGADINSRLNEGGVEFVKRHYVMKRWERKFNSSVANYLLFDVNKNAQIGEESLGDQEKQLCVARTVYQNFPRFMRRPPRLDHFDLTTFNARPMWFAPNLIERLIKDDLTFEFPNGSRIWTMVPLDTPLSRIASTLEDLSKGKALFSTASLPSEHFPVDVQPKAPQKSGRFKALRDHN
jgi:hypothetical protein